MNIQKTTITVTILHDATDPISEMDLATILREMDSGNLIGTTYSTNSTVNVAPEDVREELLSIGNDGTWFGDEVEDD